MRLSIIIPTFNSAATLRKALDSIVSQTFSDWEVLIMDGVSTDDTIKIAQSYKDPRIRFYSELDKGIYDAMNKGIKKAQGEWLYFLGSDDWLMNPMVLSQMMNYATEVDLLYGDVEAENLDQRWRGEWSFDAIEYNRSHQACFYRRRIFDIIGLYPVQYRLAADHYINIRCLLNRHIRLQYVPVVVAHFSNGGFSSHYHDNAFDKDRDRIILRYGFSRLPRRKTLHLMKMEIKKLLLHR